MKRKKEGDNAQRPKEWSEGRKVAQTRRRSWRGRSWRRRARVHERNVLILPFADPLAVPLAAGAPGPANSLPAFPFWLVFAAAAFSLVSTWA